MQLMIDLLQESPAALRLAAQFLNDHANVLEGLAPGVTLPAPPNMIVPPPPAPPASTVVSPPSNVVYPSFVPPPPPPVASVTAPAAPPAPPTMSAATAALTAPTIASAGPLGEPDSAGMPWDARIHQKLKSKKKDGTWKLQKSVDAALVAAVTQELHARVQALNTPVTAGASAPVPLPPPPPVSSAPGQAQPPPAPGQETHEQRQARAWEDYQRNQAAQAAPPVNLPPPVPVPPAPVLVLPNPAQSGVVPVDFRGLVAKITELRKPQTDAAGNVVGPPRLTAEMVTAIVQQAGAPSLQLLASMAHLVPVVDSLVDATLATS